VFAKLAFNADLLQFEEAGIRVADRRYGEMLTTGNFIALIAGDPFFDG